MPSHPIAGLVVGLIAYTVVSLSIRRPSATPLDFRDVTAPGYIFLQVAVAILLLALLVPFPAVTTAEFGWGYVLALAFVGVPQLVGVAQRQCIHQFEIGNLYPMWSILPRELLLCGLAFPAIAFGEEVVFRGILHLPQPVVAAAQWLVYLVGSRAGAGSLAIACAFLAALPVETGSLGVVIGAHAALHTLTGQLRSPGLFGGVYPLLEQAKWRNLAPGWRKAAVELAAGALLVGLAP